MTVELATGSRHWSMSRDENGDRTYKVIHRVNCGKADGPANAIQCPGLPLPQSYWQFQDDIDVWAFCTWKADVTPVVREGGGNVHFDVEQEFTTKNQTRKCTEGQVEDPLLQPPRVSGGFVKQTEEATLDRYGLPITNSAHEMVRGPLVEFDKSRNTVHIEQNVIDLELDIISAMNDTVNDAPLWGVIARGIKITVGPWEVKFYGTCFKYYTRTFDFEVNIRTDPTTGSIVSGWDRDLLDEGTKCLRGDWERDPLAIRYGEWIVVDGVTGAQPGDFQRFKDWNGENTKVILDGAGSPIRENTGTGTGNAPGNIHVEKYDESNFLVLGIPTSF